MASLLRCTMSLGGINNRISMPVMESIEPALLAGAMPRRHQNLIIAWAELHQEELLANWQLIELEQPLRKIEGLS